MKRFIFFGLFFLIMSFTLLSQTPESINYQAVIKDGSGSGLPNQSISMQVSILQGSTSGAAVYAETHQPSTNAYGLVSLKIGEGTVVSGDFGLIDWGDDTYFLRVEVDINGGTSYAEIGTMQLLSVPYALYAKDVMNKDDADADPANELQNLSISNDQLSISGGNTVTLPGEDATNELQTLSLSNDELEISSGNSVSLNGYVSPWQINGNSLYYNGGNIGIGKSSPTSKLEVKADPGSSDTDPLFQVINKEGDTVFAVFPDGVVVYIDDSNSKGNIGGFAVSGRNTTKGNNDYLLITPDSARVYVNRPAKGNIGGFAVSGRNTTKGGEYPMFVSTSDSTRVYLNNSGSKGNIGGFAVSGRNTTKGEVEDYLNVSIDTSQVINPSEARILWYPSKEAFLTGRVLIEHPDSVGTNSLASGFESKAIGDYSQALGYQATARGKFSTAIGSFTKAIGKNAFAFGDSTVAEGDNSIALGAAFRNFPYWTGDWWEYLDASGPEASGINSIALGSGAISSGGASVAVGAIVEATADFSVTFGFRNKSLGFASVVNGGEDNIADGEYASIGGGKYNQTSDNISSIGGGESNQATAWGARVGGGYINIASGSASVVAGGQSNQATGSRATTAGGLTNYSVGDYSGVLGGRNNEANGNYSAVLGGYANYANSYGEIVLGLYSQSESGNLTSWIASDRLFVIGNGTGYSNRSNAVVILKNGNMGIGNITPSYLLHVNGSAAKPGGGSWTNPSDQKLKDVHGSFNKGMKEVFELNPVVFTYKEGNERNLPSNKKYVGFIAQEVREIFPEAVVEGEDGYLDFNMHSINVALVNAVKDLKKQNDELLKRIEELEKQMK